MNEPTFIGVNEHAALQIAPLRLGILGRILIIVHRTHDDSLTSLPELDPVTYQNPLTIWVIHLKVKSGVSVHFYVGWMQKRDSDPTYSPATYSLGSGLLQDQVSCVSTRPSVYR